MIQGLCRKTWGKGGPDPLCIPLSSDIPFLAFLTLCTPPLQTEDPQPRDQGWRRELHWSGSVLMQPGADRRSLVVGSLFTEWEQQLNPSIPFVGRAACTECSPECLVYQRSGQKPHSSWWRVLGTVPARKRERGFSLTLACSSISG